MLVSVQHYDSVGQGKACIIAHEWRAIHFLQTHIYRITLITSLQHNKSVSPEVKSHLFQSKNIKQKMVFVYVTKEHLTLFVLSISPCTSHWHPTHPTEWKTHLQCHCLKLIVYPSKTLFVCMLSDYEKNITRNSFQVTWLRLQFWEVKCWPLLSVPFVYICESVVILMSYYYENV